MAEASWNATSTNYLAEGLWYNMNSNKPDFESHFYEWTPFFFLIQAISFYVNRFIWRRWENGTISYFKKTLSDKNMDDDKKAELIGQKGSMCT